MGTQEVARFGAVSLIATRLRLAHEGQKWPTSGRNILPLGQRGRATDLVSLTVDEVTLRVKMVMKRTRALWTAGMWH